MKTSDFDYPLPPESIPFGMLRKMRKSIEQFLLAPIHPVLFSIYFVFRMYAFNIHEVPPQDFPRPLFVCVLAGAILYLMFRLITRQWHVAALMASCVISMFFLYEPAWSILLSQGMFIHPRLLGGAWGLITLLCVVGIGLKVQRLVNKDLTAGVNVIAIILLLFPLIGTIRYGIGNGLPFDPKLDHTVSLEAPPSSPDIYYIILDTYPRTDLLKSDYGYDNSWFIRSLQEMGFYVAECSQSNYAGTTKAVPSALNLDYIQNLSDTFTPDETELLYLFKMLQDNAVRESLSNAGYKTVAFASGFYWAEWRDADIFIAPPDGPVTEFETVVLSSSYARLLDDLGIVNFDNIHAERFRERTRLVLKSFDRLVDIPGPKFIFVHVLVPHPPNAFDENGNPVAPDQVEPNKGFANQVAFISKAILPGLQTLIKNSQIPPVIILQGDHGPMGEDSLIKLKILNAYYLPRGAEQLYPSISPVNSFRIVFNSYFGTDFPLLEDVSYQSNALRPYDFTIIPNTCQK
jgi:hypothetical protein